MDYIDFSCANQKFFNVLGIELGLKCPLSCRHCFTSSGPQRIEEIDQNLLRKVINQFSAIPSAEIVLLAGGEPFAYRKTKLASALEQIQLYPHLHSYIITGGFWANSLGKAISILSSLPQIDLLSVSADVYHQEFIPMEYVKNTLLACEELGLNGSLCVHLSQGDDSFLAALKHTLGEGLYWKYLRRVGQVLPIGRAAGLGSVRHNKEEINSIGCVVAGSPAVLHDGTVISCCSGQLCSMAPKNPELPFVYGRLTTKTLETIYGEMKYDPILQGLRALGPKQIYKILKREGVNIPDDAVYQNVCDLCVAMMADRDVVNKIRELLTTPDLARQIKMYRILLYNELLGDHEASKILKAI